MNMSKFVKERDEALLSLDEKKIRKYCKKYGVPVPANKKTFWKGVHKAICHINSASEEQKEYSALWLALHGWSPDIE